MERLDIYKHHVPHVLLVDDDPHIIEVLAQLLSYESIKLSVAHSGKAALAKISEHKPDLVLLDVNIPEMNGYDICRALKANPETRETGVIFLTGMADSSDEEKGLSLGAVDYITKPFQLSILKARIHNHLELKRKTNLLESLVRLDGLTNIPNRRYFDSVLNREWNRSIRSARVISFLMIDLDYFKLYNDHFGHAQGDHCLKRVAQALNQGLRRSGDLLARYGGEEFAVLLPEADEADSLVVAEHLRERVRALEISHPKSPIEEGIVTLSVGCCSCIPKVGQTPQTLLIAADNNLYQAKSIGRNTVVIGNNFAEL